MEEIGQRYASDRLLRIQVLLDGRDALWLILLEQRPLPDHQCSFERLPFAIVGFRKNRRGFERVYCSQDEGYQAALLVKDSDYSKIGGAVIYKGRALAYWLIPSSGSGVQSCRINFSALDQPRLIQTYSVEMWREIGRPDATVKLESSPCIDPGLGEIACHLLEDTVFTDNASWPLRARCQHWRRNFGRLPNYVTLPDEWSSIAEISAITKESPLSYNGRQLVSLFKGPVIEIDARRQAYRVIFVPSHQYAWAKQLLIAGNLTLFAGEDGVYAYDGTHIKCLSREHQFIVEQSGQYWLSMSPQINGQDSARIATLPACPLQELH